MRIAFAMHGVGCLFTVNNRVQVDIDFLQARDGVFDFWFLVYYFRCCPEQYPEIKDEEHMQALVEMLIDNDYLVKGKYYRFI